MPARSVDMSPAGIAARLEEVGALYRLCLSLQTARPLEPRRGTLQEGTLPGELAVAARKWRILLVDDLETNLDVLEGMLRPEPYELLRALTGTEALERVQRDAPDLVLLDVMMPGMDGLEVCRRIRQDPSTVLLPVVLVTALGATQDRIAGIEAGADDFLTKPVDQQELTARVRSLLRIRTLVLQLDGAENVIRAMARAVEGKDVSTLHHTERVAEYAVKLGLACGLSGSRLANLGMGAHLHDLGKIGVLDAILNKPGKLDEHEMRLVQVHPVLGHEICGSLASLAGTLASIRHHHERVDGGGYPDHLRGEGIPLEARIVAIADAYDAMTTDRPYRKGMSVAEAIRILRAGAGSQWDERLVAQFIALIERGEIG